MRIPQVLDLNTQETFRASKVALCLIESQHRKIIPENFDWDKEFIPTLAFKCVRVLADNFEENPVLLQLEKRDQDHIQELISIDLDLFLVVPLIESENYWKRRYQGHFTIIPYQPHLGWTWKCLYLEQYIRHRVEHAQPQYKDEESFKPLLNLCAPYIHVLFISQLQHWQRPQTLLTAEHSEDKPIYHISFIPILKYLPNIVVLEICYGMTNVELSYDPHMFKLAVEDCDRLGKAILSLKHLKILKVNNSDIGCTHVQALIRNLINNNSLIEINLSYCNIGDLGAKCIGMLLNVHEKLEVLRLKCNKIGEEGILSIAWALHFPEGAHLHVLDLAMNPLGDSGCRNLMRGLVRGGCLPREISVAHCKFGTEAYKFIGIMLNVNTSLRKLDISGNDFGKFGGQFLLNSLASNFQMIDIDMRDTKIPVEIQHEINMILKRNHHTNPPDTENSMNMLFIDLINKVDVETNASEQETYDEVSVKDYCISGSDLEGGSPKMSIPSLNSSTSTPTPANPKYFPEAMF